MLAYGRAAASDHISDRSCPLLTAPPPRAQVQHATLVVHADGFVDGDWAAGRARASLPELHRLSAADRPAEALAPVRPPRN
jgi:hypothetical protein